MKGRERKDMVYTRRVLGKEKVQRLVNVQSWHWPMGSYSFQTCSMIQYSWHDVMAPSFLTTDPTACDGSETSCTLYVLEATHCMGCLQTIQNCPSTCHVITKTRTGTLFTLWHTRCYATTENKCDNSCC